MAKGIAIDRKTSLREEPDKGHNRWHLDIAPVIEVEPGEGVALETRDANDLQIHAGTTAKDLEKLERIVVHPLTGPVYVKGAEPGDLLEIEYLDIKHQHSVALGRGLGALGGIELALAEAGMPARARRGGYGNGCVAGAGDEGGVE